VVFCGDFRQVLPVVPRGSRAQIVGASQRMLLLWDSMRHLKLVHNMRAKSDSWFAEYYTCYTSGEVLRRRLLMKFVFLMIYAYRTLGKIVILIL
jgi:hypothetical protein